MVAAAFSLAPVHQTYLLEARQMQALSFAVHIPLVAFGISFPAMVLFVEWMHRRTGDPLYRTLARRWSRVMVALFAVAFFAWGVVQHEFAHQVDFLLLNDAQRAELERLLHASVWCSDGVPTLPHSSFGCERFASTLAWAYWQSPDNVMRPAGANAEGGALAPAAFRSVLKGMLKR